MIIDIFILFLYKKRVNKLKITIYNLIHFLFMTSVRINSNQIQIIYIKKKVSIFQKSRFKIIIYVEIVRNFIPIIIYLFIPVSIRER